MKAREFALSKLMFPLQPQISQKCCHFKQFHQKFKILFVFQKRGRWSTFILFFFFFFFKKTSKAHKHSMIILKKIIKIHKFLLGFFWECCSLWLFCILFCCSCVIPSAMVLVLSFEPVVSARARVGEMWYARHVLLASRLEWLRALFLFEIVNQF